MSWNAARKKRHPPMTDAQYIERLKSRCRIEPDGCWLFQGFLGWKGYGQISYRGRPWSTHRLSYHLHKGEIPHGYQVCHSCDVRNCVNPDHLWLGTNNDNVQDMRSKRRGNKQKKTICKRGHPLSGDNIYVTRRGHRHCVICNRARLRIVAGWPADLAYTLPPTPPGYRPVAKLRASSTETVQP